MSYTLTFAFSHATGQTIHAQLLTTAFVTSGSAITSGVAEIGTNGHYGYTATISETFDGYIKFYISGNTSDVVALFAINQAESAGVQAAFAEPSSVPAATSTIKDKIGWLFAKERNKRIQTASSDTVRNDADNADIGSASTSVSGGTFTKGEYS